MASLKQKSQQNLNDRINILFTENQGVKQREKSKLLAQFRKNRTNKNLMQAWKSKFFGIESSVTKME